VCRSIPRRTPTHRILAHQRSRFTHYYFYIRDEVLGPIIVRVAGFFPFHATYWLHGHSCIERELERAGIAFRKDDNAFLAVDDVAALQAAADRLSPAIIRKQLDYWTLILGPKFSRKERAQMNSRYLRNELCSNNLRDFGLKKGLDHLDAVAAPTPTNSPPKAFRSHSYSCSSTSASADRWPTAASTTSPIPHTAPTANSKLRTTTPTKPSRPSSICWPPRSVIDQMLKYSCLRSSFQESMTQSEVPRRTKPAHG